MNQSNQVNQAKQRQERVKKNLQRMVHKIAVLSGKGGVGKTTTAVNLAVALVEEGFQVGLADVDMHGPNVSRMLGITYEPVVHNGMIVPAQYGPSLKVLSMSMLVGDAQPIVWRGPLKHTAIQQFLGDTDWGDLDFMVFDMPPGTGDEALSVFQTVQLDGVVIVTTPQQVSLDDVKRAISFVNELGQKVLGFVENMAYIVCPKCGNIVEPFGKGASEKLTKEFGLDQLGRIAMDPAIVELSDNGKPVVSYYRGSEVEKSFREIVKNLLSKLDV